MKQKGTWKERFDKEFGSRQEMLDALPLHTPQEAANLMELYDRTKSFISQELQNQKEKIMEIIDEMLTQKNYGHRTLLTLKTNIIKKIEAR